MADRPTTSMSRAGRPRTRSVSVHQSSHKPVDPMTDKLRTTSTLTALTQGKGKGKNTTKKVNKPVIVVSSDSEDLEVDFPNYNPNQLHEVPVEIPQESHSPSDAPAEEQQELDYPVGDPIEELHHPTNVPAENQKNHRIQVTLIWYQHSHLY